MGDLFSFVGNNTMPPLFKGIFNYSLFFSNKYTLFDGLTYNTRGYFASCVVFFRAP